MIYLLGISILLNLYLYGKLRVAKQTIKPTTTEAEKTENLKLSKLIKASKDVLNTYYTELGATDSSDKGQWQLH